MKPLMIFFAVLMLGASASLAETKIWVNEAEKTVLVAPNPTLDVKLTKLAIDNEVYGVLEVGLNYVTREMDLQIGEIVKANPGYKVQRVVVGINGAFKYQIPALEISKDIDPMPGVEGPYFNDSIYVSRSRYNLLKTEIQAGRQTVQITGSIIGTVPMTKEAERKELKPLVCKELLGRDHTVGGTISKMAEAAPLALNAVAFNYETTRSSLIQDIKENCIELVGTTSVNSFADVLKLELRARNPGRNLVGVTFQKVYERQEIPLNYSIHQAEVE